MHRTGKGVALAAGRTRAWLAIAVLAASLATSACEFTLTANDRIERADKALQQGDTRAAIVDLKNVLQRDAGNARARLLLARAELLGGDSATANVEFGKVDAAQVAASDYEWLRWRLALATGKAADVVAALSAPRAGLAEAERLLLLGRASLALGRPADAVAALRQSMAAAPTSGEPAALLAQALLAEGDLDAARDLLAAKEKELPADAWIARARGDLELRSARFPAAEASYRRAVATRTPGAGLAESLAAYAGLADALLAQSKIDDAAKLAGDIERLAPGAGLVALTEARVAVARRDYATALKKLQLLLNADEENTQVRTMVAGIQLEQGALEQARANLRRVLASRPEAHAARRLLAQVELAQGHAADAERTLAAVPPGADPSLALMRARVALAAGDTSGALSTLDAVVAAGLPTEEVRLDVAAAFMQAGRAGRALELLSQEGGAPDTRREQLRLVATAAQDRKGAIAGLREYARAHANDSRATGFAALALAALGETAAGRAILSEFVQRSPRDALAQTNLARIEARAGRLDAAEAALRAAVAAEPSAERLVALAQLADARGRPAEVVGWLEKARAADAQSSGVRTLLARAYLSTGQLEDAAKVADELVRLAPALASSHLTVAAIAIRRKDTQRALSAASEAVRLAPVSALAWLAKGEIDERVGRRDAAREAYRKAATLRGGAAAAYAALARLELDAGRPDAALLAARAAQKDAGSRVAGLQLEGEVLMRLSRPAEAVTAITRAQEEAPSPAGAIMLYRARMAAGGAEPQSVLQSWLATHSKDVQVRIALAEHWQRSGKRERAIAEYEAALPVVPVDAVVLNNLAWLYHEAGDARALATARRAFAAAPQNVAIADTLGVILVAAGQTQEGIRLLRDAVARAPRSPTFKYHLAEALARTGASVEARALLDEIVADSAVPADDRARATALAATMR